jgi:hypothetical protein
VSSYRGATAGFRSLVGKDLVYVAHLVEVDFNPWIYLTDAAVPLTWNGNEYLPSYYLGVGSIAETSELLVNSVSVTLSGVDQAVVSALLQETYLNRKLKIRTVILNGTYAIIADPVLIFDGRMNRPTISVDPDGGQVVCAVEGVSAWTDFERRAGRHTNDADQQRFFPGDKGFANVASMPDTVFWGVSQQLGDGVAAPQQSPGSGGLRNRRRRSPWYKRR